MSYKPEIFELFKRAFKQDKSKYIKDWIVSWKYVDMQKPKSEFYSEESLYTYSGYEELLKWFQYHSDNKKPDYFPESIMTELVQLSQSKDKQVLETLGLKYDFEVYDQEIGRYNAQDYYLQNFYPSPERNKISTVLDFGAGFGRQANLWSQKVEDLVYVGMEAIPNSYCVQHLYYSHLGVPFYDYCLDPKGFSVDIQKKGLYHLPTWRMDLLPSNSFDLVICSQVLSEINGKLTSQMIREFHRILKPGGALYVRDPGPHRHKHGNKMHVDNFIDNNGFVLEFRPYIADRTDLHGFPRIWRREDPMVEQTKKESFSLLNEINFYSGGIVKKIIRKVQGKPET